MKKYLKASLMLVYAALALHSCEDVPEPYTRPGSNLPGASTLNTIYQEDFADGQGDFTFSNVNLASGLSYVWKATSLNGNSYLVASAFANSTSYASEAWAVSPAINLGDCTQATLSFKHAINKLDLLDRIPEYMTLWACTDYSGNAATATWTQLEIPNYPAGTSWTFVESGDVDLKDFCGKQVYIGFKYLSTEGHSGSWEINAFKVEGDGTPMDSGSEPTGETTPITMAELIGKMTSAGAVIDATANRVIEAVVQCDYTAGNNTTNNLPVAVEGATAPGSGVTLYGSQVDAKTLDLKCGDKIRITLIAGKAKAQDYSGLYEVTGAKDDTWCVIEKTGTATITPVQLAEADLANLAAYQAMTVTVAQATTADNSTWGSGTHTFTCGATDFTVYANTTCKFANAAIVAGNTGSVTGVVSLYKGASQIVPRHTADVAAFTGEVPEDPNPPVVEGGEMTADHIRIPSGSVSLGTNAYGTQNVTSENTWYRWTFGGVAYAGCKVCTATADNGGGIQVQGNASDAAKQGFLGNVDAISTLKSVTLVLRTKSTASYAPDYSLYAGTAALPTDNAITATSQMTEKDGFKIYTQTFDLSAGSYTHFAVRNDKVGALYIDKIIVEKK